ncbi:MAG: hypothetical protein AAGI03_01560 [Pseudomonadota bacterium]
MSSPSVMVTAEAMAEIEGVTKAAVTKKVRRFAEEHELEVERDRRGRIVRFSQAMYERLAGLSINPNKATPKTLFDEGHQANLAADSLDEAKRREAWLKVERLEIDRAEAAGLLVRRDALEEALVKCARATGNSIDRIANNADELGLAYEQGGVAGLRKALIIEARAVKQAMADALAEVGKDAVQTDPFLNDEAA